MSTVGLIVVTMFEKVLSLGALEEGNLGEVRFLKIVLNKIITYTLICHTCLHRKTYIGIKTILIVIQASNAHDGNGYFY